MTSEDNLHTSLDERDPDLSGFPGHILRQAREQKGLSQDQVVRDLNFMRSVIEGLESGNFSRIKTPVFARGYIRSYARYLGVDADALLSAYDKEVGGQELTNRPIVMPRENITKRQAHPGDVWVKAIGAFLVALIVGGSWWWWQSQDSITSADEIVNSEEGAAGLGSGALNLPSSTLDITDPDTQAALIATTEINTQTTTQLGTSQLSTTQLSTNGIEQNNSENGVVNTVDPSTVTTAGLASNNAQNQNQNLQTTTATGGASQASDNVETQTLAAGEGRLLISFNKDCWVEIRDSQGGVIASRIYSKFEAVDEIIQTPVKVLLGRFSAVEQFTFNGQAVDLKPHTRKDIVRITLEL